MAKFNLPVAVVGQIAQEFGQVGLGRMERFARPLLGLSGHDIQGHLRGLDPGQSQGRRRRARTKLNRMMCFIFRRYM